MTEEIKIMNINDVESTDKEKSMFFAYIENKNPIPQSYKTTLSGYSPVLTKVYNPVIIKNHTIEVDMSNASIMNHGEKPPAGVIGSFKIKDGDMVITLGKNITDVFEPFSIAFIFELNRERENEKP
jgi:hypothetical protein